MQDTKQTLFIKLKNTFKILTDQNDQSRERKTFLLHFWYSVIEGGVLGVLALNEFVILKALHGSNYQVGLIFQFMTMVLLISVVLNELLKRTAQKRKMLLRVALATRLPLLLLLFFPKDITDDKQLFWQMLFLGIFLIFFLAQPIIMPIINLLLKHNYKHENFAKYYGYATSANKIIMLIVTFSVGILYDNYPDSYIYTYPAVAVLGILSVYVLTRINYDVTFVKSPKKSILISVNHSFRGMFTILKSNKAFFDFETGFMFYGFAWLLTIAVIAVFMEDFLQLSYSDIAFYKNYYTTLMIILIPYFGNLLGKTDPRKFGIYTFIALLLYLAFMLLTEYIPVKSHILGIDIYWILIISFTFYGLFSALVFLLWNIGSAYFAKDEDAADYQSVHLTLTGVRASVAPLFGVWLLQYLGYTGVFALGMLSVSFAVLWLIWSLKNRKIQV